MFKYRVLTFTIILSMLLFYATPINSVDVKAEEVTYTQRQLQDVGAWFIGERLLEGAISDFDFSNLPTDLTPEDFLADLGAVLAEGDPLPLMDDMSQAIDDIWNGLVEEYSNLSSEEAWDMVKDFFYTLWYDVPQTPSLPPLVNVFGIAGDLLEAADIDYLLQYANTDIPNIPEQPSNIKILLDYINKRDSTISQSFWFYDYPNSTTRNNNTVELITFPWVNYSWVVYGSYNGISSYSSNDYGTPLIIPQDLFSLYINSDGLGGYTFSDTYSPTIRNVCKRLNQGDYFNSIYVRNGNNGFYFWNNESSFEVTNTINRHSSGTLETILNYIKDYYKNVNIYVDNTLISQSYVLPVNPIANTDLTYPNYEPAKYIYPDGTYVDWNRLYTIIYNAVSDGIVLDFGDLEDCFVDVNGQTAIATLGLVRNDYDNLVQEQFTMVPYPRFNDNLWLTNLAEEMTEPAQNGVVIIENAYNIFPLPLQKALLFAGALLLFGLLIRRFLE